jgi:hypothetical protein
MYIEHANVNNRVMIILSTNNQRKGPCSADNNEVFTIINNVHEYVCEKEN